VLVKVMERLAVNKQRSHRIHMERFNLKKLNKVKEQYHVEVSDGLQLWTLRWKLIVPGKLLERISIFQTNRV
jgi:hypothetical protein